MNVAIVELENQPYIKKINNDLIDMEYLVNGYLETFPILIQDKLFIGVCNVEGRSTQKPNRIMNGCIIYGDFLIVGFDGLSKFQSLTEEDKNQILSHL